MASIDDRIVQMQFDNSSFEKKLQATLESLATLEKALKFENAKQGLTDLDKSFKFDTAKQSIADLDEALKFNKSKQGVADLDKALKFDSGKKGIYDLQETANKFNLGSMSTHIESVSAKFLALSTIGFTALSNITTKAMQTGEQIIKSLSLDLVMSGFKEYELNINSIQTILSNTKKDNTTLADVTKALDELNEYADKTIYNFGQMTRNIGTFTAAGVKLDPAVAAIKGIANLAAMSGSTSEQASTVMYQLSQAMAAGELHAIDWISVVNGGMGGQMFQNALWQTGKALGTIQETDISDSFEHWKSAGNSFKDSLKGGWVTTEVLTTALNAFGGSMTEADLIAKGFSKDQAKAMIDLGVMGTEAATKVRTFTQLISTTKEAIGSGWSESFRTLFGDFNEATTLFSTINDTVGGFVKRSSDARNAMLKGWADMGGRALGIEALRTAFQNLGEILKPIKDAFREIFPKTTMFDLMELTKSFELLVIKMRPSAKTVENIHSIFKGFFSMLQVGWEILKQGVKFVAGLFGSFGAGSGAFLDFAAKIGDFFTGLNNKLIEGKGIEKFFENLAVVAQVPIAIIKDLTTAIVDFFGGIGDSAAVEVSSDAVDRISGRFENLGDVFGKLKDMWEPFAKAMNRVQEILGNVWTAISNWFHELGTKLAAVIKPGDFDAVADVLNLTLLGAIALLLKKFVNNGIKFDIGGGFLESVSGAFKELTGVLSAMQTSLKADALLKIAIAIGILSAALLVLATIDSKALTKALNALAIGFTQAIGAFAILNKMAVGPKGAATFTLIASGMILLSGAMLIFAAALKVIATMDWEELAKGLTGFTVLLGVVVAAVIPLSSMSGGIILISTGLIALAVAMNIMGAALKIFATMSWEEIGKGLATVASLLTAIVIAMNLMPVSTVLTGPALVAVATSMVILGAAMKIFATLSWEEIGKGLIVVAGALVIIGKAMGLMPLSLPITAAGLILVGVALIAIGAALKIMSSMSWSEIGRGLTTLAGSLLILAVATNAMTGAVPGAIALGIVAPALLLLSIVLKEFAEVSWQELIKGLAGMASVLIVLGTAAFVLQSVVPALMGLGVALVLLGGGFALFGAGVALVAMGLETLTKIGTSAIKMIPELLGAIGKGIPALLAGFANGLIQMAQTFADAAPVLVESLVVILGHILDGLKELIPKALVVMGELIDGLLKYIGTDGGPKLIQAGIQLLLSLLTGIRKNIGEVVKIVAAIIKNFLDAFAKEIPGLTDSIVNFIIEVFKGVANGVGQIAGRILFDVGIAFIAGLMEGIQDATSSGPMKWFKEMAGNVLEWIGDAASWLLQKGKDIITGLLTGIIAINKDVATWFTNLPGNIKNMIGDALSWLKEKGKDILQGLWNGITEIWNGLISWFTGLPERFGNFIKNPLDILLQVGKDILQGLWNGMVDVWHSVTNWLGNLNPAKWFNDINPYKGHAINNLASIGSDVMIGLQNGMEDEWDNITKWLSNIDPASAMNQNLASSMSNVISGIADHLGTIEEFNPIITPVLDLTRVTADAKMINDVIQNQTLTPYSYQQAQVIAGGANVLQSEAVSAPVQSAGVKFEQNIYAPTQLSTSDIYKQTRNQIAMAKEELSIP